MSMGQVIGDHHHHQSGSVSLAAHHLAITAESICFMPAFGLSSAATTLVGQSLGAKREDLADSLSLLCIKITVIFYERQGRFSVFHVGGFDRVVHQRPRGTPSGPSA